MRLATAIRRRKPVSNGPLRLLLLKRIMAVNVGVGGLNDFRHWILGTVIYPRASLVFRFAMSLVAKSDFPFSIPSQFVSEFQSSKGFFSRKFCTWLRFWWSFFAAKRFSEKSLRRRCWVFRPCPLRCRRWFRSGTFTFSVIERRKRPFVFYRFFFGSGHTLFEMAGKPKMR